MAILFGLVSAVAYGAADFLGGVASRRAQVFQVVFWSQLIGSSVLFPCLPLVAGDPSVRAIGWGAASGVAGALGVTLLYRGLSHGRMSIVAPVTSVLAASLPVLFGLAIGERPGALALIGVVIALGAVALVSRAKEDDAAPGTTGRRWTLAQPGMIPALGAGIGFAVFFIFLDQAGNGAGLWPLLGARISSTLIGGGFLLAARAPVLPPAGTMRTIGAAGLLDAVANICFIVALRSGLLSLVAVLVSLYPATTVILARTVLGERLARTQLGGLGLAACGVTLIALG